MIDDMSQLIKLIRYWESLALTRQIELEEIAAETNRSRHSFSDFHSFFFQPNLIDWIDYLPFSLLLCSCAAKWAVGEANKRLHSFNNLRQECVKEKLKERRKWAENHNNIVVSTLSINN